MTSAGDLRDISEGNDRISRYRITAGLLRETLWTYRHWFAASQVLAALAGLLYVRYVTPVYRIGASILIRDDSRGTYLGDMAVFEGMGIDFGKRYPENEIELLKSRSLTERVLEELQLYVRCFAKGRIKTTELFEKAPFRFHFVSRKETDAGKPREYEVRRTTPDSFRVAGRIFLTDGRFGDTISLPEGRAVILRTPAPEAPDTRYTFVVCSLADILEYYRSRLQVSGGKTGSMLTLVFRDILPDRGKLFLERLIHNHIQNELGDKHRIADSTLAFINENLERAARELAISEQVILRQRTRSGLVAPEPQVKLLLENNERYFSAAAGSELQLKVVELLSALMHGDARITLPVTLMEQNSPLKALAQQYNELGLRRERVLTGLTEDHPEVLAIDRQLSLLREQLLAGLQQWKQEQELYLAETMRSYKTAQHAIREIPEKERSFLDYTRQRDVQLELYTFLLRKRVETSMSRSSVVPNARIVDNARAHSTPFRPNRQLVALGALILGTGAPFFFIYLKTLLRASVGSRSELQGTISVPLFGEVERGSQKAGTEPSLQTEQFRALRVNLHFYHLLPEDRVWMITSTLAGEGKSYVAGNLAKALAQSGKNTVLVECDLRRPQFGALWGLEGKGLAHYFSGKPGDVAEILQFSGFQERLDVITAGFSPPDPLPALMDTGRLLEILRERYEYILLDCPPVALVPDAYLLVRHVQSVLYIVRQGYTPAKRLDFIQTLYDSKRMPKMGIVLNDAGDPFTSARRHYYTHAPPTRRHRLSRLIENRLRL